MPAEPGVRLQKILARTGVASRRASERCIADGRVSVNGRVVTRLGTRADPERDDIRLDERRVGRAERRRYILLYKPTGYVTTRSDPQRRRTVLDLVPNVREYVYPVGRLDYESEGLLILTNDGELAGCLTHPRHGLARVYEAVVVGVPSAAAIHRLAAGVMVDGRRTAPAEVQLLGGRNVGRQRQARVRIKLQEGRNRQIRRMFAALGHTVVRLRRVQIGPIRTTGLRVGAFRDLSPAEVRALRRAVASDPSLTAEMVR